MKVAELGRETAFCKSCGSTMRTRAIIHILSTELFGESLILPDFPVRTDITGIGMSDWDGYALMLARKFNYKNTFYHQEPKLNITHIDPALEGRFDFVISSDVFEHVCPPVSVAFENVRKLLKPDGVLIFTVPYSKEKGTVEHFPESHDYQIIETDERHILKNTTKGGVSQVFENLVFHGGDGLTLEMRLFSESSLMEEFHRAKLNKLKIYKDSDFDHGIHWGVDWSLPMSVKAS
ncbi:MAG: methyltransferase domain-containing protein [Pyrinomonadaceae bacterium]|nr:methyltransferase domain-containing protein [Pyrinomonadaceae bacterium]